MIFDCDGVLVDSEIIAKQVVASLLERHVPGLDAMAFITACTGRRNDEIIATVQAEHGIDLPAGFLEQVEQAVDEALIAELEPIPGAAAAVAAIPLPKAIASNSPRARVERSLARAGVSEVFGDRLFTAELVTRPKPSPEVYLLAASTLGADPARCIVVEDSVAGVTAAASAGMTVIGFTGASHAAPGLGAALIAAGAAETVAAMADLPGRVAAKCAATPTN